MATRSRGFTLMELLVVVAIIMLLSAASVPAIGTFLKGQRLDKSGRLISTAFNDARRRAITTRVRHYLVFYREAEGTPPRYIYKMRVFREGQGYSEEEPVQILASVSPKLIDPEPTEALPGQMAGARITVFEGMPQETDATYFVNFVPAAGFGWCVFEKDGTIVFKTPALDVARATAASDLGDTVNIYDVNATFGNNGVSPTTAADIVLEQAGEASKRCFVDIDPNTGRVKIRVLETMLGTGTTGG